MKRLLGVALALSLLGSSAAMAAPYGDYRGYGHENHNNNGALFAGIGLLALGAILASQNHNHYQHGYGDYNRDYRGGYDTRSYGGYYNDQGRFGNDYGGRQSGYGYPGRW